MGHVEVNGGNCIWLVLTAGPGLGKQLEFFNFIKGLLFFIFITLSLSYQPIFICLDQRRDYFTGVEGIIDSSVVFVLLSRRCWSFKRKIELFFMFRSVLERTATSFFLFVMQY